MVMEQACPKLRWQLSGRWKIADSASAGSAGTQKSHLGLQTGSLTLEAIELLSQTADGTVNIRVYYQDGNNVFWVDDRPNKGSVTFTPSEAGYYIVICTGAGPLPIIAGGTFFVIPELAFGTATATVAGLGAFELEKLKRRKRHEI